ncbi:hypothetical protein R1sor_003554 [Riccia sorocarpa]|uniref:Uncharacterized protein n=1 Tax=Riccia sorocarpa TaxID=122646 RepID=A0ABD3H1X8_9MARC
MATSSRGDKGKAPMVEQEDIGTEEGELLDVHPPLPEPIGRSGSNRKQKKHAREEEEFPVAFDGACNREFLEEKEIPNVRPLETSVSAMSQRLARFLEEVPKNWDKHYDVWLKSREFEIWTEDVVRQKGEKPLLIIPGLIMGNDEEKKKWKRTAEVWAQWFQPPKSIKDHACTSAKYKACDSMSDNTICFISKDSFTRRDETTRLGVGGAGRTHRVGGVDEELVPVLGAHDVVHYALKIWHGEEGDTKIHEKCIREMMAFLESHPAIILPIGLSKDKKRPILFFPLWNGGTLEQRRISS